MMLPWGPIVFLDIAGSTIMLLLAGWCFALARNLKRQKPDDIFRNYLFLFTLAIVCFAISRSFGHLVKQVLLLAGMGDIWRLLSPFSGAVNSATFIVIFAFCIYFFRIQKVHTEIEYYKNNLEEMIAIRTEELEASKNTLENILNNSNPIDITSTEFDLVQANEAYYSFWPRTTGAAPQKCYESRPGDHCHTDACPLKMIMEGSEEVVQEVSKTIRGERYEFIVTARPFRGLDGQLIGMVESFQDITLRKKAEQVLIEMDRMKSEFISTAAHELNTPLSALMGYAEILRKPEAFGGFSEAQKQDFINEVYDRGEALYRIIDDLLDISRIESGNPLPLVLNQVDLVSLLEKKVELFLLGEKTHRLRLDIPGTPVHRVVHLDRHRINQVLDNLLSNAVKYSPGGGEIVLGAVENENGWEISVRDRGIGMTPEQVANVFEKFYRADMSDTAVSGLGLGMSVVRQVVNSHGGHVRVESHPGEGTTVTFTIPINLREADI